MINEKGIITPLGKEILNALASSRSIVKTIESVKKDTDQAFDMWWKTYPATDIFEYKGKKFMGSRALRVRKDECKAKFNTILLEGEFSTDDLLSLLAIEVSLKKEQSLKDNENKMRYMQNSLTYLNQKTYENFVHVPKKILDKPNESSSTVDI